MAIDFVAETGRGGEGVGRVKMIKVMEMCKKNTNEATGKEDNFTRTNKRCNPSQDFLSDAYVL